MKTVRIYRLQLHRRIANACRQSMSFSRVDCYGTGGYVPPIFRPDGHCYECPSLFEERSQVKLTLFVDFMAFYFTKTHFTLMMRLSFFVTQLLSEKAASASGGLCPPSPTSSTRALPLNPAGNFRPPDSLLCPPIMETGKRKI